jgi:circadian clock protein KaiC
MFAGMMDAADDVGAEASSLKENETMTVEDNLFPTGLSGLDRILGGGLNQPSLSFIVGSPGAGKTVLASNIIFNAARQGMKAIIVTSFSEGIEQYVQHMRPFRFFEPSLLGQSVQLFTLDSLLNAEDTGLGIALARAVRTSGAKVVLLDGFQGADSLLPMEQSIQAILSTLAVQIRYLNATFLVTIAGEVRDSKLHTEMTVADAIIGLNFTAEGRRHQRLIEVVKIRGRAQQAGLHSYAIDASGVRVFPRIEGHPAPTVQRPTNERAPFQLPELDRLLGGGPNVGTTMLLAGAPGVGKTMLGLQWALAEEQPDSVSLYISFVEHREQLERKAAAFGFDLHSAIERGSVRFIRLASVDLNPDQVASLLLAELASPKIRRLVIDDMRILLDELGERTRDYLSALNDIVYSANATALYLCEIAPFNGLQIDLVNTPLAVLGDNVIIVQQYEIAGHFRRLLAVLRMRLSFFDRTLRELSLNESGIHILKPEESQLGLLATGAKLGGGVAPAGTRTASSDEKT